MSETISEQIKQLFHLKEGNWVAKQSGHIDQQPVIKGMAISIICHHLGGIWEGDVCTFSDDSFINFSSSNEFEIGQRR